MESVLFVLASAFVALFFAGFLFVNVKKYPSGNEKAKKISEAIRRGASAYLTRQYKSVSIFFAVVFFILLILSVFEYVGKFVPYVFLLGGFLSALSGFVGMRTATMANLRTVSAAQSGLAKGLKVAFSAGSVVGFSVVGLGLLGLSLWFFFLRFWYTSIDAVRNDVVLIQKITSDMLTFGMGVSCMSLFARVGGGIFTKAADVGADLVGKIEIGIPEDDPRNPAVIADNVGDNVGDVAGMGADLYESYISAIVSASALSLAAGLGMAGVIVPMIISAVGIIVSIAGTFFVKAKENSNQKDLLRSLRTGTWASSIFMSIAAYFVINFFLPSNIGFFYSVISGILAGVAIGFVTEYFTSSSYRLTRDLAKSSETGAGTVVIGGLSLGMLSTVCPVLIISAAILISFFACGGNMTSMVGFNRGLYGVGITAVGMLSTLGITLATDAYGPIADNAGGIAEMSELGDEIRQRTDALDALGNTTAATGKGFAIGSAALTSLVLIAAYITQTRIISPTLRLNLNIINPSVLVGLFVGTMLPFLFAALTMDAVGRAAMSIVHEVRRQFKSIAGLMEGTADPDYSSCVDICARASIKLMILPSVIAVLTPIVVGFILGVNGVSGLLAGTTMSGFVLAVMMSNSGGAWDNAKKYIESGNFGGKGSESHKSAVVGDTVGDPFKDTSGPAINILIKLTSMVAIVFASLAISFHLM
ncbi:MAG: sodium-translocating pyrophosphatase [Oscillospiraceae bacterium]|jgi:K(+)-stimulated pyrophosphate-energized sodium pump|nr:sodium-translocating pyrophosphatase [Oscillospiraceae bacterium]